MEHAKENRYSTCAMLATRYQVPATVPAIRLGLQTRHPTREQRQPKPARDAGAQKDKTQSVAGLDSLNGWYERGC
jgi:hypothetical protein